MNIVPITSLDHPSLLPYRTLRRHVQHEKQGIFVAESEKVVRRLLASDLEVVSILVTDEWLTKIRHECESRVSGEIFVAPKPVLETIVGIALHQGIMAVGRIPTPSSLDQVLRSSPKPLLLVAVDGLTNAENLGALVRNCTAFGAHALLVGETSSSPYLRRAVRNSMGAVFRLPVIPLAHLAEALREFKNMGIRTIGAHPGSGHEVHALGNETGSCCIVFGSESNGLSQEVLGACDEVVGIHMENDVDSLNVASASAVFLHALRAGRQRPL